MPLVLAAVLRAELPSIRLDRMQPIGAAAGTSVEVEFSGRDTEDVTALHFERPGFSAELLKPGRFKLTVSGDVPAGTYDVRLAGKYGVSNPRLFAVSRDLTDVAEAEPNDDATKAQVVPLNSAVNGMFDGNGQDVFRVPLKKGQRVTIDCQSGRLDSPLDANLILTAGDGQILANNGDYYGRDPFLDFAVPADGDYLVILHDLSYRGGWPYRLVIGDRPQVENVFPRAIQIGQTVQATALGRNLGGKPSSQTPGELALEELVFPVSVPAEFKPGRFLFVEHPTDHSVLPTAATCTLDGFQVRAPAGASGAMHAGCLLATPHPVTIEAEPNDDRAKPQPISLPAVISGRFDRPRDADWYEFEVPENGSYVVDVASERIAGRADPYVIVQDEKQNAVAEFDDYGHRMNAFDGHLRDPYGTVNLQPKQKYRLLIQDRYSRGGPRYQYVLCVRKPEPDFHVAAIHAENPGPAGLNIRKGGTESLDLIVHSNDGFSAPIEIKAAGLPAGVHAGTTFVNNNQRGVMVFWADANAADFAGPVTLTATAREGDKLWERDVRPYTRVWAEANIGSSRPMRDWVLGVRDTAPYALEFVPDRLKVKNGQKAELKLRATRLWPEFKDKINVVPLGFPGQFQLGNFEVPAAATEVPVSIVVQQGTRPGPYTLVVQGQAQVPFNKDPAATSKPNTLVSSSSRPVTIDVE